MRCHKQTFATLKVLASTVVHMLIPGCSVYAVHVFGMYMC